MKQAARLWENGFCQIPNRFKLYF